MESRTRSQGRPGRPRRRGRRGPIAAAAAVLVVAAVAIAAAVIAGRPGQAGGAPGPSRALPVPVFPAHSLAPAHGALFGAWVQPPGGDYSARAERAAMAAFERTIGRRLAISNVYVPWAAPMPIALARWDLRHGSIPMISWDAARTDKIAEGKYDALIRAQARKLRALHGPVLLRWFSEMDLGQRRGNSISPASFIMAWRHMHAIFSRVGATNVRWVWCPSAEGFVREKSQAYFPGKAYVDWTGADGYNWAPELAGASWRSFEQIFSTFYSWGLPIGKPMLVGEFGTIEGAPGAKAIWFRQADLALRTQFPAIRAVVYFNSDHQNFGRYFDWRVTTSRSALAAFRAFAHDPYFDARPAI